MVRDERLFKSLSFIFNESQDGAAAHHKLIAKCQQVYKETEFNLFLETFTAVMQPLMINMQKNPHADRCIEFIAKFSASVNQNSKEKDKLGDTTLKASQSSSQTSVQDRTSSQTQSQTRMDLDQTENELGNPFLTSLVDHLIEINRANCDAVRYRCCQLLAKLMGVISNEQSIDEDLFDRLCDAMLERLKDINSRVQVQAISAIYRLQDPNDRECRVMKALVFLMNFDPHWQVRFQALANIAFTKQTLPEIIDRVRDPHPQVRRKALMILSEKVLIKFISIEKRLFILNYALKDSDQSVTDTCCKKLLPSWLAFKENDLCKLLAALDVVDSTETCQLMLNKMYTDHSLDSLCNDFSPLLNEKKVIPIEKLNAESVFYWHWICSKCKKSSGNKDSNEVDPFEANNTEQIDGEEHLDGLLPSLTEYCEYVEQVLRKMEEDKEEKSTDERNLIENSFTIKQLIKMFSFIDFSDVHGKKSLTTLCHNLFSNKNYCYLFETLMSVYKLIYPNLQQRVNNLVELISDIKDPANQLSTQQILNPDQEPLQNQMDTSTLATNQAGLSLNESVLSPQEIEFKISEIKFQRFKLTDDFDNMYKELKNPGKQVDMQKLADLRAQIKECDDQITQLQNQLKGPTKNTSSLPSVPPEPPVQQVQPEIEVDPIEMAYHCLQIAVVLLKDVELKQLTPQIRSLCDSLILPNISSINEDLRAISVFALGLICILKLEMAQKYVPLFLEIIQQDKKEVVLEAFKAMINCMMAFSVNKLVSNLDQSTQDEAGLVVEATSKIMSVMTSLLDHEDTEVNTVAVEGFCKLYMTGHILSAKLFSKLVIMYYSPLTENDIKLRAFLAAFLPQFAFFRAVNQLCVEESFMLTLKCLINAPTNSYLCEIDLTKVMETLFHLTNPKNLIQRKLNNNMRQVQSTNICHENIVKSICYEILKDDNTYKFKTYLKILQMADLTDADYLSLKSIFQLAEEVHEHIEDKLIKKMAKKFSETVHELLVQKPEYKDEQNKSNIQEPDSQRTMEESQSRSKTTNETTTNQNETANQSISGDVIDTEFPKITKKSTKQLLQKNNNNNSTILNKTKSSTISDITQSDASISRRSSPRINRAQPGKSRITIENISKPKENKFNLKDVRVVVNKLDTSKQDSTLTSNTIVNDTLSENESSESEVEAKEQESQTQESNEDNSDTQTSEDELEKKTKKLRITNKPEQTGSLKRASTRRVSAARRSQSASNQSDTNSQEYEPPVKIARSTKVVSKNKENQPTAGTRSSLRSQSARKEVESSSSLEKVKNNNLKVQTRASSRSQTRKSPRNKK